MNGLVIAEHDHKSLHPATLSAITAAKQLGSVTLIVIGYQCQSVAASAANIQGIDEVLMIDHISHQHFLAETLAATLLPLAKDYSHVLATASSFGKNLMPRLAALLDVAQISDIITIESEDTFKRPIYAGNAIATVRSKDAIKVITVRETAFEAAATTQDTQENAPTTTVSQPEIDEAYAQLSGFIKQIRCDSERPELTTAKVVVAGGRGMQSKQNFQTLEALADQLGAAIGATRAAVDAGFVPNDQQIGQTGKIIAPKLYIAIAISGAIQHLAGIMDSKVIIAINKDENAPILKIADYSLVADWQDVLPVLVERLKTGS